MYDHHNYVEYIYKKWNNTKNINIKYYYDYNINILEVE